MPGSRDECWIWCRACRVFYSRCLAQLWGKISPRLFVTLFVAADSHKSFVKFWSIRNVFFTKSSFCHFFEENGPKGVNRAIGFWYSLLCSCRPMPSPGSSQLRQCPRPGVLDDGKNVIPQNAYLLNVENILKLSLLQVSWLFFYDRKGCI